MSLIRRDGHSYHRKTLRTRIRSYALPGSDVHKRWRDLLRVLETDEIVSQADVASYTIKGMG